MQNIGLPSQPDIPLGSMFEESYFKIYRARRHIYEANSVWNSYVEIYGDNVRLHFDPTKGSQMLLAGLAMPADFVLSISDCIRCLRSSLDYLVAALARAAKQPDNNVTFPFHKERNTIASSFNPSKKGKSRPNSFYEAVSVHYPDLEAIILDEIQPYDASDGAKPSGDFLYRLITMDNIDKHRIITPIISMTSIDFMQVGTRTFINCRIRGTEPTIAFAGSDDKIENKPNITIEPIFPDDVKLSGKPVVSALVHGCDLATDVIKTFEAHFQRKNAS